MHGMRKTTVYLPEELKRVLEETARNRGESVDDIVSMMASLSDLSGSDSR